jgi:predicted HicB family RNase H-like nuclease
MGRPRGHDSRISIGLRIEPELHEAVKAAAEERDVSVNWLINKAIEDLLSRLLPVEEIRWTR